ncbi:MAG: universal stress protein [Candidatus Sericytochromatia bacterium]
MFNHILFPSDHSEPTLQAFARVVELAGKLKARVTLFHAYELLSMTTAGMYDLSMTATLQELELSFAEKARIHLGDLKDQLDAAGIENTMLIERGPAGPLIVDVARTRECDLIVIGSRGLSTLSSVLLGSVSNYVVHHSPCPVLVMPVRK